MKSCILKFLIAISAIFLVLFSSGLSAAEDPYDEKGPTPHRSTLTLADFEHIDPFHGGLSLRFEDLRLPGNNGHDFVIQRVYNSRTLCNNAITDTSGNTTCFSVNEDSWVGMGWKLHFGRLICNGKCAVEMPDGSRHQIYTTAGSSDSITKDFWKYTYEVNGTIITPVLTLTNGTKIYFGHWSGLNTSFFGGGSTEYYATKIQDANGNVITITYYEPDSSTASDRPEYFGAIKSVTDSVGRVTQFILTPSPIGKKYRLASIVRPDNSVITFTYQEIKDSYNIYNTALLESVIPPTGNGWRFNYDVKRATSNAYPGLDLQSVMTPNGGMIRYTYKYTVGPYSNYQPVVSKEVWDRNMLIGIWSFKYFQGQDGKKEETVVTDPCNRTVKYRHYSPLSVSGVSESTWRVGLPISKEIVGEETTTYEWVPSSLISYDDYVVGPYWKDFNIYVPYLSKQTITRGGQNYITTYSNFDSYGNPRSIAETGNAARNRALTYWYNTAKNIVAGKPAAETVSGTLTGSFTTNYTYDANTGNLTQKNRYGIITNYAYYSNGNLLSQTDPRGNTTSYQWTSGRISRVANPLYSASRVINTMGTVASETNGRNYTTSYAYDGNLRLTGIVPPAGNPTTIVYPPDNSFKTETRGGYWLKTTYDGIGRVSGTNDSKGIVTNIAYKNCGPKNYTTSNIGDTAYYDNFGRVTDTVHQDNTKITYIYPGSNVTVTDEAGKPTTLTYTAFGSPDEKYLVSVKDPLNNTATYTRNMLGSITKTTQGTLNRTFVYNTKNYLTSETHPESGTTTYTRDNAGNMTSKTDLSGKKTYTYDKLHRLTKIAYGTEAVNFTYDNADNRISMTSPSATVNYTYDAANRLTQKTSAISARAYTIQYTYDGNDNVTYIYYPNGRYVNYAYNTNNQVTSAAGFGGTISNVTYHTAGSSIGLPKSFTYSNGLTTNITYNNRNLTTRITSGTVFDVGYAYDSRGNTTALTDYKDATRNQAFTYDNLNRLTGFNGSWGTGSYTYDSTGNRLSKAVAGVATSYAYSSNKLASTTGGEPATFTYNGYGSLTGLIWQGNSYSLTFDLLHNLRTYKLGASTLADFAYDGDGTRVTKASNGNTVVYHYGMDGSLLSETDSAGNLITDYIYLNGKLAARAEPTALNFYHADPAGSPLALTDASGNISWKADYKPFGEEQITTAATENYKMFVGKEKDKETGLYYFGARYMQDRNARFVSVDPVGPVDERSGKVNDEILLNPQMLNRYAYALNNPYKYYDPDGKFVYLVAPIAIPALEALSYSALGIATFKVLEQAYKNYREGMYNENSKGTAEESAGKAGTYAPDRELPRDKRSGNPVPESDNPHTQLGKSPGKKSGKPYNQGREFGKDGKHVKDVDFSDHGRPKEHPNPHQHRIDPKTGERGSPEPIK